MSLNIHRRTDSLRFLHRNHLTVLLEEVIVRQYR